MGRKESNQTSKIRQTVQIVIEDQDVLMAKGRPDCTGCDRRPDCTDGQIKA